MSFCPCEGKTTFKRLNLTGKRKSCCDRKNRAGGILSLIKGSQNRFCARPKPRIFNRSPQAVSTAHTTLLRRTGSGTMMAIWLAPQPAGLPPFFERSGTGEELPLWLSAPIHRRYPRHGHVV